ncbi:MAG: sensor histidine kinase, partial [Kineosporiaceae bacterium]
PDAEASRGLPHTAAAPVVPRVVLPSTRELDVVLRGVAAVLLVGLIVRQLDTGAAAGAGWLRIGLLAAVAVPVAWLRRAPLLAGGLSGAALVVHAAAARPADPLAGLVLVVPLLLCPLAAGAGLGRGPAVGGLIGCLMVPALLIAADPAARFAPEELAPAWAVVIGCWAAGRALRAQVALLAALADAAAQLDEEQRALARARLEVEHARVAHELHDRIAHAMTIIALQAAAARRVWTADPVRAREHVAALRLTVLETVQELRPLLLSLSRGAGHAGEMPPGEARLAALPVLVDQARAAGLRAALRICGAPPASVAPAVDLAGYRVVQEALTNAARHAPGSRVTVTVRYDGPEVRISVVNGPSARRRVDPPLPSAGHGLAGMRARVDACRGDFEAAPAPHGGFAVTARLPVPVTA